MGSKETMAGIAQTFIDLTETQPFEKISISDIVADSGKNRKTFYYHFESKGFLVHWIFRRDLAMILKERFPEENLVYEHPGENTIAGMPYYAFKKNGVRSINGQEFLEALAACFESRRDYYAKALRQNSPDSLRVYLLKLYTTAFKEDIHFILSNRFLPEENINFLAEFYAGAMIAFFVSKTCDPCVENILENVEPFGNIIHFSLEDIIKEHQLRRAI